MDISVVIPLYNEEESLPELSAWIERVMQANGFTYEVIFVDDGSTDRSLEVIRGLAAGNPNIHAVSFSRNYGKSPALNTGFRRAKGMWSSRWMPTSRTAPTRFRSFTA